MKLSNLWSILVAVMLSLCLATVTSCSDDDHDGTSIVGTWYYVDSYYSASEYYVKFVFKENGTGQQSYYENGSLDETDRFEWDYDERSKELAIFFTGDTDEVVFLTVKSVSSSKLVLYDQEERETFTLTSRRP